MDGLRSYLDAVLADPENDEPRLAMARHLKEQGDARGEHIRLSCELEHLERDDPARQAMEKRVATLPTIAYAFLEDIDRSFPLSFGVRRGFIEELSCSGANFALHAERMMTRAPIRVYERMYAEGEEARLAACPALAKLRRLKLSHRYPYDSVILESPHLRELHELEISPQLHSQADVDALAATLRPLNGLRVLATFFGTIDIGVCSALATLAKRLNLTLDLRGGHVPEAGLATIREILGVDRVLPRPQPRMPFRFGFLDLTASKLSHEEIRGALASGEFRSATKIALAYHRIGEEAIVRLAKSDLFPNLVELRLSDTGLSDAGALAIANEAVGLERLEVLDLGDFESRDGTVGVGDAAVQVLARSPRLPALRKIIRSKEHHVYHAGSREDLEVTTIAREDGRTVESEIHHRIWP